MEATARYRFLLIALLALSVLFAGCIMPTSVCITNRNPFTVEVILIDAAGKRIDTAHVPSNSAVRMRPLYGPRAFEYALRVMRLPGKHRRDGKRIPSIILGKHVIGDTEINTDRLHYIVEGGAIIASNDEPQDPETLADKRFRVNFYGYLVGILGCIVTIVRLYRQRNR